MPPTGLEKVTYLTVRLFFLAIGMIYHRDDKIMNTEIKFHSIELLFKDIQIRYNKAISSNLVN